MPKPNRRLSGETGSTPSIPFLLIKTLQRITAKFEVSECSAHNWREAIYDACRIFVSISKHKGGVISVDLIDSSVTYRL